MKLSPVVINHEMSSPNLVRKNINFLSDNFMICVLGLILYKVLNKFAADNILLFCCFFSIVMFSERIKLDISCELSAWQTIHMKCQDLFL